ncbi:ubiquitin-conjugating enzyme/RWD-like protein [Mycena haematopus]|nr:ubiquitin-conjugating enzyme/RWD-like protein [Mycena haematopus]
MSKPSTPGGTASNTLLLRRQLTELTKHPVEGFSAGLVDDDNLFEWEILVIGAPDTLYEGGFLKARLSFPPEFPLLPPKMRFITPMWHPNIYPDGVVCVSILHAPGEDQYGYEDAGERWMPVHTVESIVRFLSLTIAQNPNRSFPEYTQLVSVISLLSSDTPNTDSPANVEAAIEVRKDIESAQSSLSQLVCRILIFHALQRIRRRFDDSYGGVQRRHLTERDSMIYYLYSCVHCCVFTYFALATNHSAFL